MRFQFGPHATGMRAKIPMAVENRPALMYIESERKGQGHKIKGKVG
jgi:hypothetical protein